MDQKLKQVLRKFILEHNFSWNHDDWLDLVRATRGYEISEQELGELLEAEKKALVEKLKRELDNPVSDNIGEDKEIKSMLDEIGESQKLIEKREAELNAMAKQIQEDKKLLDFIFYAKSIDMTEKEIKKYEKKVLHNLKERYNKVRKKEKELEKLQYEINRKELELQQREENLLKKEIERFLE